MKPIIQKIGLLVAMLLAVLPSSAYDFEVDGIYYNILSLNELTCEVTYNPANKSTQYMRFDDNGFTFSCDVVHYPSYTGSVTIPPTVNYKGRELSVTGIGEYAFFGCGGLKSLSLPSSITQIKRFNVRDYHLAGAFDSCNIMTILVGNAYTLTMFDQSIASTVFKARYLLKNLVLADDFYGSISVDFSDYKNLTSLRSNAVSVPPFSDARHFSNEQFLNLEVFVPEDAFSAYQSSNIWKNFWELKAMKSVKSITLNETSLNLEPNQTSQLLPTILPEDAFDTSVTWTSSNPIVASVDEKGIVSANLKGDAIITASSTDGSNIIAECAVHVDLLVKEIELSEHEIGLEPGETKKLEVTIKPDNAYVKDVYWSSDDEEVASVDQNGNITAKNIGIANITVTTTDGSNQTANCRVTVAELVKSVSITPNEATLKEGETLQLNCSVSPESATYKDIIWSSENNDIATVDKNGLVTAVSSGTTIIKANAADGSNVFGECKVSVTDETIEYNGFCYQRNSPTTLKIVANAEKPYNGDCFIPSNAIFNGQEMQVTEIGVNTFADCDDLIRIIIPNTINKINEKAFKGCSNLRYVKLCDGSSITANFDILFSDSPIEELYIGSNGISFNPTSRILSATKGMILGNNVTTFPPKEVFNSLEYFIIEDGDMPIIEPENYCTSSMSLLRQLNPKDPNTKIYYQFFYLVTYTHLSPIINAIQNSKLNYLHIGRNVQQTQVDTSKTQETIPTTAGSRYQEFGYKDEVNYQYQDIIVKNDYNRNPLESIYFDKSEIELTIGESVKPTIRFKPSNASFTTLEWKSSDEKVAVVDIFGRVTKIDFGVAEITATTTDGSNQSAMCLIMDKSSNLSDVSIDKSSVFDVYSLQGILMRNNCSEQDIQSLSPGIYLLRQGEKVEKYLVH